VAPRERAAGAGFEVLLETADAWNYPVSYGCSAAIQALAIPFLCLARRERSASDAIVETRVNENNV
jgi:hypothetical protein